MEHVLHISSQLVPHLKALRKLRGMSQTELGARVGVGQTRIADIEANPGLVSVEQLLRIFRVLGAELVLRTQDKIQLQGHIKASTRMTGGLTVAPLVQQRTRTELEHFADMLALSSAEVAKAMNEVGRQLSLPLTADTAPHEIPHAAVRHLAERLRLTPETFQRLLEATISRRSTYLDPSPAKGSW